MTDFGYAVALECDHKGGWCMDTIAGYAIRWCSGCGASWVLWRYPDERVGWVDVLEDREPENGVPLVPEGGTT